MAKDLEVALRITAKDSTGAALGKTRAGIESISRQLQAARNAFLAFQGALGLQSGLAGLVRLADEVQSVNARLKLATASVREFAQAQQFAYRVAAATGAGYASVATLYGRLAQTASAYGLSQQQIQQTTEATALALKVSGASAAEAASVVRQFSQALGSGVLRGDEFNSIMENGARLAQALADGLGLPVGELRALAEQGLLTTDVITKALTPQLEKLRAEAERTPRTVGQAASELGDAFGRVVDRLNSATGATAGIAGAITALARNIEQVLGVAAVAAVGALAAATVRGGMAIKSYVAGVLARIAAERQAAAAAQALAANEVAKAQAMLASANAALANASGMARLAIVERQLVPAKQQLAAAQAALTAAMAAGTGVARGLSTALAFVGGPLGLILTLLSAGATAWALWGSRAQDATDKARQSAERAQEVLARRDREARYGSGDAAALREEIERLEALQRVRQETLRTTYRGRASPQLARQIDDDARQLERYRAALAEIEAKERETAAASYDTFGLKSKAIEQFVDGFRAKIDPLKAALDELRKKYEDARKPIDSAEFRRDEAVIRAAFAKKAPAAERTDAARLAAAKDALDAELALVEDNLRRRKAALEASLQDRLVSVGEYYARKTALEQQGIDAEIARQRQLLVAQNAITRDPKSSESDRIRARGEVQRIEAELIVLNNRRAEVERANAREAARAERELADALEDARLKLAQITGTETDADRRAAIERSYRDLKARLAAEGQDSSLIDRLIDVEAASRNLDALQAQWRQALDAMRQAQDNANVMRDAGVLTQAQAQQRITQAAAEAKAAMEQLLPTLEAAMQRLFPPEEVARRMQALRAEILKTQPVVENLGTKIAGQVQDAFASMLEQIGSGAKTAKDAFLDFARSVIAAINRIAAQKLAEALFDGGNGGFDLAGLVSSGLKKIGFASGGYVSGPGTSTSDSIPARLSAGEYVVRAEAVRRFGVAFLDAINGLRVPPVWSGARLAFAAGGVVQRPADQDGGGSAVRIVNVIDPAMAADYLNSSAGERVVLNVLSRNAGAVRQILM